MRHRQGKAMLYAMLLFSLFVALIGHEIGHAYAMVKCGIAVKEIGLGLPIGPGIKWTINRPHDPEHPLTLSFYLFLVGAFVRPYDEGNIEKIPAKDSAFIYGAGVMANIFMMTVALFALTAMIGTNMALVVAGMVLPVPIILVCCTALCVWMFFSPRTLALYLFPILGILSFWFLVFVLSKISGQRLVEASGGIVAAGQVAQQFADTAEHGIYFFALISFALAQFNLIPLYPLDGGHIAKLYLTRFTPKLLPIFNMLGMVFFVIIVIFSLGGDLRRIVLMFQ